MSIIRKNTKAELDASLVEFVSQQLQQAITERDCASLIVSGGSTPKVFFQQLSSVDLPWSKVSITLVDERCVPAKHEQSNAKLVSENLLQQKAAQAQFESMFIDGESVAGCRDRFRRHSVLSQTFDVVILGMGADAHTASIFPQAAERDRLLDLACDDVILQTDPVTVAPLRLSFTRKRLLDTRHLLLHINGDAKWQVFEQAQQQASAEKPISMFMHQQLLPLQVFFAAE